MIGNHRLNGDCLLIEVSLCADGRKGFLVIFRHFSFVYSYNDCDSKHSVDIKLPVNRAFNSIISISTLTIKRNSDIDCHLIT